jgi:hypothetical protein
VPLRINWLCNRRTSPERGLDLGTSSRAGCGCVRACVSVSLCNPRTVWGERSTWGYKAAVQRRDMAVQPVSGWCVRGFTDSGAGRSLPFVDIPVHGSDCNNCRVYCCSTGIASACGTASCDAWLLVGWLRVCAPGPARAWSYRCQSRLRRLICAQRHTHLVSLPASRRLPSWTPMSADGAPTHTLTTGH